MSPPDSPLARLPNANHDALADRLFARLVPYSNAELAAARNPWPHVWATGERGLFPIGEVTLIAAPGREGKTYATVSIAIALALENALGGLHPLGNRSTIICSAEDDRAQYARKVEAWAGSVDPEQKELICQRVIVPDMGDDAMSPLSTLVMLSDRAPIEAVNAVNAFIEAIRAASETLDAQPALLIFETASTLSDADEGNQSFRVMIRALRRIARALGVAVALVHHTSQATGSHLPELALSAADVRGGTALAYNARQILMLVSLGSTEEPFPSSDARTTLRKMMAPLVDDRVSILLPIDSSKSADPAPVVFAWRSSPAGPRLEQLIPPPDVAGRSWRALSARLRGERVAAKTAARDEECAVFVRQVVDLVRKLHSAGTPPTARAVSLAAARSPTWATPYLVKAVHAGELVSGDEAVPRVKGSVVVFRPAADSTEICV